MARYVGVCHICGSYGHLSFEHVPPKSAFNDRPVVAIPFGDALQLGPDDPRPKGKIQQRGMGAHTLCERCNNGAGSWYGSAFVEWCYQGLEILIRADGKPTLIYPHHILPLRIIKQIATMFFSAVSEAFSTENQELVQFVLDRERRYLPSEYSFYVYYNIEGTYRFSSTVVTWNLFEGRKSVFAEITFPPFGYVMTLNGTDPPNDKLFPINHFAHFEYGEFYTAQLKLPVLPTFLTIPGDYRTREEIRVQERKSLLAEAQGGDWIPQG